MTIAAPSDVMPAVEPVVGNYFVAVYPPFSAWTPGQVTAMEGALDRAGPDAPLGLYIHVPFCAKKCDYCYYLSYVGQPADLVDRYVEAVVEELRLYAARPGVNGRRVAFVYFGGGTPSTLSPEQVRTTVDGLRRALDWEAVEEVTFECAPRSVRRHLLEALRDAGVTRVSMGVQSFDNELLKHNGRVHLAEDTLRAYSLVQEAGFDCLNLDLMVGLAGETWLKWRESVRRVIELNPDSVTIYQTEIPYNTQLYRDLNAGHLRAGLVSWPEKRARLDYAFNELIRAGYTLGSAYHAVKEPGRHRFRYQHHLWHGADLLGLGVASFGYFGGMHYQNVATLEEYLAAVDRHELPFHRAFQLSDYDQLVREFVLQLKFGAVSLDDFRFKFGVDPAQVFAEPLGELATAGFLTASASEVRLTRAGLLCVDRLLPRFYDPPYRDTRYT